MARISDGDIQQCLPSLYRFSLSLTKSEDRAHDLVQDCVERCLRKQHLFDGANLRAWMFTVCHRVFVNQIRREQSRGPNVEMADAPPRAISMKAPQETQVAYREVVDGMAQLNHGDQRVLALVGIRGMYYEEAARELGVPIGTVRSRVSRARTRLRAAIGEPGSLVPAA